MSQTCQPKADLEDDGWECGLIITVLVGLGLRFLLPVPLVGLQGLSKPPCYIRLQTRFKYFLIYLFFCHVTWQSLNYTLNGLLLTLNHKHLKAFRVEEADATVQNSE